MSEASPPAAVVIAVSGERRSCDTERSTAVLTTFERRSALVSITCVSSSSRLRAAATSVSSAGSTRSCSASSTAGSVSRGTITVPTREPSTSSGSARRRSSESVQDSSIDTDGEAERGRHLLAGRPQRLVQVGPAEQQARHLGGQVRLAPARLGLLGARLGGARQAR